MAASRSTVDACVDGGLVRYGITTGFGKFSDLVISNEDNGALQRNLIMSHACGVGEPFADEVVRAMLRQTWYYSQTDKPKDERAANVLTAVQDLVVTRLMDLAANEAASPAVRAVAAGRLRNLRDTLKSRGVPNAPLVGVGVSADHLAMTAENIDRFLTRPDSPYKRTAPLPVPPGDPIGGIIK
jgi:hypothetical protein